MRYLVENLDLALSSSCVTYYLWADWQPWLGFYSCLDYRQGVLFTRFPGTSVSGSVTENLEVKSPKALTSKLFLL